MSSLNLAMDSNQIMRYCGEGHEMTSYYEKSTVISTYVGDGGVIRKRQNTLYLQYRYRIYRLPDYVKNAITKPKQAVFICPLIFYHGFEDTPVAHALLRMARKLYIAEREVGEFKAMMRHYKPFVKFDAFALKMITTHLTDAERGKGMRVNITEVI